MQCAYCEHDPDVALAAVMKVGAELDAARARIAELEARAVKAENALADEHEGGAIANRSVQQLVESQRRQITELEARAEEAEAMSAALHMEVNRLQTKAMGAVDAAQTAEAELARLRVVGTFNEGIAAAVAFLREQAREVSRMSAFNGGIMETLSVYLDEIADIILTTKHNTSVESQ